MTTNRRQFLLGSLGTAAATKRPTSVILIAPKKGADFDGSDRLAEALEDVKAL